MYYDDNVNAEYQIPAKFLTPPDMKTATTTVNLLQNSISVATPAQFNTQISAREEQKLYQELSAISDEVIACRKSILANIY